MKEMKVGEGEVEMPVSDSPKTPSNSEKKKRKRKKKTKSSAEDDVAESSPETPDTTTRKRKKRKRSTDENGPEDFPAEPQEEQPSPSGKTANGSTKKEKRKRKKKKKSLNPSEKLNPEPSPDSDEDGDGPKQPQQGATDDTKQSADEGSSESEKEDNDEGPVQDAIALRKKRKQKQRFEKATKSIRNSDDLPPLAQRNAYMHGLLDLPLAPGRVVRAMDDDTRLEYLRTMSACCHDVLGQLHSLITTAGQGHSGNNGPSAGGTAADDDLATLENQLTTDMVRLRRLPLARQYVEITLWQRVKTFLRETLDSVERLSYGAGEGGTEADVGLLRHLPGDVDVHFNSFRDAYLKDVVETYQQSLERVQEAEALDKDQVGFLIKSLEAGADLFANVACWDRRRDNDSQTPASANKG